MKRTAARRRQHEQLRRPLARLAIALGCAAVLLGLAHAGLALWVRERAGGPPPEVVAPPPLRPAADAAAAPAPDYRWVDRGAGIAEIPVERAIRLIAVDGHGEGSR